VFLFGIRIIAGPRLILFSVLFLIIFRLGYQVQGNLIYLYGFFGAAFLNSVGIYLCARTYYERIGKSDLPHLGQDR